MDHIVDSQANEIKKLSSECCRLTMERDDLKKKLRDSAHTNTSALFAVIMLAVGLVGACSELGQEAERSQKLYQTGQQCADTVRRCGAALDDAVDVIVYRCPTSEQPHAPDADSSK